MVDGFLWLVELLTSTIRFSAETSTASTHVGRGAYTRFDFNSTIEKPLVIKQLGKLSERDCQTLAESLQAMLG
jgi:phage FluMu protein gp41